MFYKVKTWGEEYEIRLFSTKYVDNNSLAITAEEPDGMPFTTFTVNLEESRGLPANQAYLDTNNNPWAEQFLTENKLGKPVGCFAVSGFCLYPLWEFDLSKIEKRR